MRGKISSLRKCSLSLLLHGMVPVKACKDPRSCKLHESCYIKSIVQNKVINDYSILQALSGSLGVRSGPVAALGTRRPESPASSLTELSVRLKAQRGQGASRCVRRELLFSL